MTVETVGKSHRTESLPPSRVSVGELCPKNVTLSSISYQAEYKFACIILSTMIVCVLRNNKSFISIPKFSHTHTVNFRFWAKVSKKVTCVWNFFSLTTNGCSPSSNVRYFFYHNVQVLLHRCLSIIIIFECVDHVDSVW